MSQSESLPVHLRLCVCWWRCRPQIETNQGNSKVLADLGSKTRDQKTDVSFSVWWNWALSGWGHPHMVSGKWCKEKQFSPIVPIWQLCRKFWQTLNLAINHIEITIHLHQMFKHPWPLHLCEGSSSNNSICISLHCNYEVQTLLQLDDALVHEDMVCLNVGGCGVYCTEPWPPQSHWTPSG